MDLELKRFGPDHRKDFFHLHSEENGCGWCYCTAWWIPTWKDWSDRDAAQNKALRDELLDMGEYDGYLLFSDNQPIGWSQVGQANRLKKLKDQFSISERDDLWAITCFLIAPTYRRKGMASHMLAHIVEDIKSRGAKSVLAFPQLGQNIDQLDMWNGPVEMYIEAGFEVLRDDPSRPILHLVLAE